jgi:hypothetical protein
MGGAPFDDDVRDGGDTNGDQLKFSRLKNDVHGAQELHRLQFNVKSMWWLIAGKDEYLRLTLLLQAKRTIATSITGGSSDDV